MPVGYHESEKPRTSDPAEVLRVATNLVQMVVNAAAVQPTELASVKLSIDDAGEVHCRAVFAEPGRQAFFDDRDGTTSELKRCECGKLLPLAVV